MASGSLVLERIKTNRTASPESVWLILSGISLKDIDKSCGIKKLHSNECELFEASLPVWMTIHTAFLLP